MHVHAKRGTDKYDTGIHELEAAELHYSAISIEIGPGLFGAARRIITTSTVAHVYLHAH